jgi:hypothetical protein
MGEAANPKDGAGDLAILYPERHASIAGVAIIMREYSFAESLRHAGAIQAFTDAITGIALGGNLHDLDSLRLVFGEQSEHVMALIAVACDQPLAWVQALNAQDGEQLLMLWWGTNADFFLQRVLLSVQLRKLREIAGPTSTPPSSPPATGRPTSAATPTVN